MIKEKELYEAPLIQEIEVDSDGILCASKDGVGIRQFEYEEDEW